MANPYVLLETSMGEILVELFADKAPKTVENFLSYVDEGFYEGTIFHRVIRDFMNQGGGFDMMMKERQTKAPVANEASPEVPNLRGTIAMARTMEPHSATAQFFINAKDNHFLDRRGDTPETYGYCVFGRVEEGMDVVDKINKLRTKRFGFHDDVPVDPVTILSAKRFEME
ncbi:peptidyl-prolyl cis-trans isomerase cyclophilin type [Desulfovibrio sp. X2]|uniref:peptidylprolyl isomerase n=1 Tax=Desulfovibrio sp. X2 TaxID=941449 RepID=UPI000358799D|nr:peptidylprolyl isomerase [Desulfovibrio sp. X2]EPR37372.1 peptidyl-prolyl cis-trans isomerase cyclophilin type [Desulfovibrio sp. X2]